VIRLSGESVIATLRPRFQTEVNTWDQSRSSRRYPGVYQIEGWRSPVPLDLWLWPTQRSYTGQPSAELHLVGSPPVVDALLEQLYRDGARPARAGEFTLRAFLAGRVDLVQAEAVLGVIDATDDTQLRTALSQLAGGLSKRIAEVRESLLLDLADLEAGLDFVEEDIEFVHREQMQARIGQALKLTIGLLKQSDTRMVSGTRPQAVLAGLPNAGKSTLFNRLIGEQRAIVSDQAGTTRDYLSASVEWNGVPLDLIDTAGADLSAQGVAELAEVMRAEVLQRADLVIWCTSTAIDADERTRDAELRQEALRRGANVIEIWTQSDRGSIPSGSGLVREGEAPAEPHARDTGQAVLAISARTGAGIEPLKELVRSHLSRRAAHHGEWLATTAARSRDSLDRCVAGLQSALAACEARVGDELLSLELRGALDALGEICGQVQTDDVLDRIFSRFCIGK
jgi:tRNA modification GTPase